MAVSYTSLLGLALPSTGEWVGTWGTNQNNYITEYLDAAIAGAQVISGSQTAVTLSTANGTSLSQAGTGATGSAQYAVIRCTGNPASLLTITAPATSKSYIIINATSTSQNVKIVAAGPTTGVTVGPGKTTTVVWNGSDFVTASFLTVNLATDVTGVLPTANGGTGLSTFVANQVFYPSSSSVVAQSANLTFDGSTLAVNSVSVGRGGGGVASNTVVGSGALAANTVGAQITAVGNGALAVNTASFVTAVGYQALNANTTAVWNTAIGGQAAAANTTGQYITAVGYQALYNSITGDQQTAVGNQAMYYMRGSNNTAVGMQAMLGSPTPASNTGTNNTAIGRYTLYLLTSGSENTAVGTQAAYNIASGNAVTAIGHQAMYYMVGGSNTAVGAQAMQGSTTPANNTGIENTAVGRYALTALTSGQYNIAVGHAALLSQTSGSYNTAIGNSALREALTSNNNTAVGFSAGYGMRGGANTVFGKEALYGSATPANNTGTFNTAIGEAALNGMTSGTRNTTLGYQSGRYITSGSKNTVVGSFDGNQGGLDIRTASNYVVLSDGDGNPRAYWDGANATFNGGLTLTARLKTAVGTVVSGLTITPTSDDCNQYNITSLNNPATIAAPSGSPVDGQKLLIRIVDDGTARALTWNAIYRVIGTILPTTTVATKTTYVGCVYNSANAAWDVVAVTTQV